MVIKNQSLDRTSELKKHAHELVKQFVVYDVNNRIIETYTAATDAVNGEVCEKTEYTYIGLTPRIEKRRETVATWLTAWDI